MPVIGAGNSVINTQTTSNAQATTGTAATTATTATAQGNVTVVGNPNASGAKKEQFREVAGLPAGLNLGDLTKNNGGANGATQGLTGEYIARPSGQSSYLTGYGDVTRIDPTIDGFEVDVQIYVQKATDEIALILQLPLLDKKSGKLTFVNLDLLTHDAQKKTNVDNIATKPGKCPVSGAACNTGRRTYSFSLKQINEFIKKSGLDVQVKPGDRLAISGLVAGDGHRVMNSTTNSFSVPRPLAAATPQSPISVQTGKTQTVKAQDLPLDISIKLSPEVLKEKIYLGYDYKLGRSESITIGDVIEGDVTTRLESEYKGSVSKSQMDEMVTRAYELTELSEKALKGDKAARKELDKKLGKDLVLTAVKRHWMADDGQPLGSRDPSTVKIVRDQLGRPTLDPMKDGYSDDKALTFSNNSGAARVRGNAQKMGHAEFKLNGGVLDPKTGIRQRVEVGISMKAGATEDQLVKILKYMRDNPSSKLALSPLGHLIRDAEKAGVSKALIEDRTPWADVTQIRHKFELKNLKTGTAGELSLDKVNARTLRKEHEVNGQPQEKEYYVIETELDHLQINSANVTEMQEAKTKSALLTQKDQDAFFTQAKQDLDAGKAEFEVMSAPQLHSVEHVKEGSFRQTASYKDFEGMNDALLEALCGTKLPGPARQKSAHFAELLGLVKPEKTTTV
ncbi:MAG: hypothetical protein IT381_00950 [Deltaproteobacteria bacterium]|nr:hypothetical protein [Deltaproteobacteria bacterium]